MSSAAGGQVTQPPPSPPIQGPVRDPVRRPPPELKGTGVIRGRVVAADKGAPIRREQGGLSPAAPPIPPAGLTAGAAPGAAPQVAFARPRSVTTDAQGAFE